MFKARRLKCKVSKKELAVSFSVGADGITLQPDGFGQVYTQCLSEQQLQAQLPLMQDDLQRAVGRAGMHMLQQTALHRGGGWQGGSASGSASGNVPLV